MNRGNPTQEGEQVGDKTFGDFGSFQSHSPSSAAAAKPRRGRSPRVLHGEAMPFRLAIFRHVMTLPTPLTLTLSRMGRGNGDRGRLRFANRPYWRSHANTLLQGKDVTDPSP
ncbi:MAG: hypothetical protein ACRDCT_05625 [Shewanella sp.]